MRALEFTLTVLTIFGGWRPESWTSLEKHILYHAYMALLNGAVFLFTMSQFMRLIYDASNADEIIETLYMILVGLIGCLKISMVSVNHKNFVTMIDNLTQKPFKPIELSETVIQEKFNKMIKNITIQYLTLILSTISYMIFASLLTDFSRRDLTFKAWFPFNHTVPTAYYLVYTHQMISMGLSSLLNVVCDNLFSGLLLQICCQFEILEHRLSIADNQEKIRECVIHHCHIFELARGLNDKLAVIVAIQLIGSSLVVCCLLFRVIISTTSSAYIQNMMCLACALLAIFYYCWFGNEVRLKSLELSVNIYKMNWPDLNNNMKKCLLMIMNHAALTPIKFTSARIIPLNLESFVAMLKASYSILNVMRQSE